MIIGLWLCDQLVKNAATVFFIWLCGGSKGFLPLLSGDVNKNKTNNAHLQTYL